MAQSVLRTGPNLVLKVKYEGGESEKTIGYAQNLNFNVVQGQKSIFTVDSVIPQEIAQGAAPSFVRGTATLFMPKGSDPVRAGLVPPVYDLDYVGDSPVHVTSKYFHWRIYDRYTNDLAFGVDYVKVNSWSVTASARQVVRVSITFEGQYFVSGVG